MKSLRTKFIETLLFWSNKLDENDNDFNKSMFNKILGKVRFENMQFDDDQIKAMNIIDNVKEIFKAPDNYHLNKTKYSIYLEPRQIAMTLIKDNTDLTLSEVGAFFGGKDHATVLHAHKKINNLYDTDKNFKLKFDLLLEQNSLKYKR